MLATRKGTPTHVVHARIQNSVTYYVFCMMSDKDYRCCVLNLETRLSDAMEWCDGAMGDATVMPQCENEIKRDLGCVCVAHTCESCADDSVAW